LASKRPIWQPCAQNGLDFHFNITSLISNIPHLTNSDIDLNMPFDHNLNYYSINDFHRTMGLGAWPQEIFKILVSQIAFPAF
jgi:hypothetical protein